jgi:hypothetical protein
MTQANKIDIQGVTFSFTTGAIDHYFSKKDEPAEVFTFCQRAIQGDLKQRGEVLLACFEQAKKTTPQPIEFADTSIFWDWFDELPENEKFTLMDTLMTSVSNRLDAMEKMITAVRNESKEQKKK